MKHNSWWHHRLLLLQLLLATFGATSSAPKRDDKFASLDGPLASFLPFGKGLPRAADLITDEWVCFQSHRLYCYHLLTTTFFVGLQIDALKEKRGPVSGVLTPVVIVPPLLGSRLYARLDGAKSK